MLPTNEFCIKANAPIEYIFNCHTWCDVKWCWAKELDDALFKIMINVMEDKVRTQYEMIQFNTV